jgi:3-oxoacyl-[acyl-carrier protein] reductase
MSKVVIITGSSKGLGAFLAKHYLEKGYIVAGCSRSEATIQDKNYRHFILDVSDEKAVVAMVRGVKKEFGRIDVLLNNAGVASMNHFLTTSLASVKKVFETNVFGSFLFARECAKSMMKNKSGVIVNYSTVAVPLALEGEAIYSASKAALESLTKTTAKELGIHNIRVNSVGPTPVATDLIKAVPKEKIDELIAKQTIHRLGLPQDVANVIDFFIDAKSEFITGQTIYLGGVN